MNIVVFGADGFVGSAVTKELIAAGHHVDPGFSFESGQRIDLLDEAAITAYLSAARPESVINCAGVVDPSGDFENNVRYSANILNAIHSSGSSVKNFFVSGSAGEYGVVDELPVNEEAPLRGDSPYARSKIREEQTSLELGESLGIPVTVARIFNPVGPGMKDRFLIPSLLRQIDSVNRGESSRIEVSRLDARRDFIDVRDIAVAFRLMAEGAPDHDVYNIGSGNSITNGDLLAMLLAEKAIGEEVRIVENSPQPEPRIASEADASRLRDEFGWKPTHKLEHLIKELVHAAQ